MPARPWPSIRDLVVGARRRAAFPASIRISRRPANVDASLDGRSMEIFADASVPTLLPAPRRWRTARGSARGARSAPLLCARDRCDPGRIGRCRFVACRRPGCSAAAGTRRRGPPRRSQRMRIWRIMEAPEGGWIEARVISDDRLRARPVAAIVAKKSPACRALNLRTSTEFVSHMIARQTGMPDQSRVGRSILGLATSGRSFCGSIHTPCCERGGERGADDAGIGTQCAQLELGRARRRSSQRFG